MCQTLLRSWGAHILVQKTKNMLSAVVGGSWRVLAKDTPFCMCRALRQMIPEEVLAELSMKGWEETHDTVGERGLSRKTAVGRPEVGWQHGTYGELFLLSSWKVQKVWRRVLHLWTMGGTSLSCVVKIYFTVLIMVSLSKLWGGLWKHTNT